MERSALLRPFSGARFPFPVHDLSPGIIAASNQEDRSTVRELESGWRACLHSLCGRLRATVPARGQRAAPPACMISTDGGCRHGGEREDERGSSGIADCRAEEPCPTQLKSGGNVLGRRLDQCSELAVGLNKTGGKNTPKSMATGSCATEPTAVRPTKVLDVNNSVNEDARQPMATGSVPGAPAVRLRKELASPRSVGEAGCEAPRRQAIRHGLPGRESEAQGGVWFDKALLKVGARVPWGRPHRGRFAKVKLHFFKSCWCKFYF